MDFKWIVEEEEPRTLKSFFKLKNVSKRLLAHAKHNGKLYVNHIERTVRYQVKAGDEVILSIPPETAEGVIEASFEPLDIIYEDRDIIVINKPSGLASIPSRRHPHQSIANRLKGYYVKQQYENQAVHIVTRLDIHTSGLVIVAKHRFSHALMDQQLREKAIHKEYIAIVWDENQIIQSHGWIDAAIARKSGSFIEREVSNEPDAKPSLTEYECIQRDHSMAELKVILHTGRTHQIRVHFSHIGCPLVGDTLYGGTIWQLVDHQALHCHYLEFNQPFTGELLQLKTPLPEKLNELKETISSGRTK
ncbi:RluA family pseudouridine synthase [Atopobacter phocae]|uniref:RluA family pseudouridine synthase n=1 Tax=Atopobacter phocae TaxID=136492 RepID=UPI00046EC00D|nr:RluA family pseudouridine synthase [Atopobacter phocae]